MSEEGIKKAEGMLEDSTRRARRRRSSLTTVVGAKSGRDIAFIRNTKQDIADARISGYSPVIASENAKLEIPAADKQPDGTFVLGDTIAMEIPTKVREANNKADVDRMDRAIKRVKDDFHKEGREAGVATFEESGSDLETVAEAKRYEGVGRKLFAMGAGFDDKGNLVHQGKIVASQSK